MNKLPHILPLAGNQSMGPVPVPATEIQMSKTPPVVKTAVSAGEQGKPGHVVKTCRLYDYKLDERLARQKGEISAKTQNVALEAKKHSTYESENSVEHIVEHSIATPNCWLWELSVDLRVSLLTFYKFYPSGDSQNVVFTQPIQKEYVDIDALPMPGQNSPLYKYYPKGVYE